MFLFKKDQTEIINVFNYNIIKHKVPLYLYNKKSLREDVDGIFESEYIQKNGFQSSERIGKAYSTCGLGIEHITNLSDIKPLLNHISLFILNNFYKEKELNSKILYTRMWSNKMYKGCEGTCHTHNGDNDGTAIFYFNVPKNGSKLILFKYDIGKSLNSDFKHISYSLKVNTGDLIIHGKNVPHSVSKHMNDEPRICFIFDFKKVFTK